MKVTLNIGLEAGAMFMDPSLTRGHRLAFAAGRLLCTFSGAPLKLQLRADTPEPTLVVEGTWDTEPYHLHEILRSLAEDLEQDCIACRHEACDPQTHSFNRVEALLGPGASAWGPFDPSKFITFQERS